MINKVLFHEFLKKKGFTEMEAYETIKRINENRPDRIDIYQIKDFERTKKEARA